MKLEPASLKQMKNSGIKHVIVKIVNIILNKINNHKNQ